MKGKTCVDSFDCLSLSIGLNLLLMIRHVEAIDSFQYGGWDNFYYFNYKMEAEAKAVEAA